METLASQKTGKPASKPNLPSSFMDGLYKKQRLSIAIPVRVFVTQLAAPVMACTYELSRKQVRLRSIQGITAVGQEIWIQRQNRKAKYRVIWIGTPDSAKENQFGAECVDVENVIWEDEIRRQLA